MSTSDDLSSHTKKQQPSDRGGAADTIRADSRTMTMDQGTTNADDEIDSRQRQRQRHRQDLVLMELNATVNTLNSISQVMSDIIELTDPPPATTSSNSTGNLASSSASSRSVAVKQQLLLAELAKWRDMGQS
jgi:hypothetical protein